MLSCFSHGVAYGREANVNIMNMRLIDTNSSPTWER